MAGRRRKNAHSESEWLRRSSRSIRTAQEDGELMCSSKNKLERLRCYEIYMRVAHIIISYDSASCKLAKDYGLVFEHARWKHQEESAHAALNLVRAAFPLTSFLGHWNSKTKFSGPLEFQKQFSGQLDFQNRISEPVFWATGIPITSFLGHWNTEEHYVHQV